MKVYIVIHYGDNGDNLLVEGAFSSSALANDAIEGYKSESGASARSHEWRVLERDLDRVRL